ncbi:hypothetical protein T492DRAFT_892522, partial [Pavlovales sp. CCMP2436]
RALARPAQLADGLTTLSGVPAARWKTLNSLDEIQLRNKVPVEAPPDAPFFLATRVGLEPEFSPFEAGPKKALEGEEEGDG